MAWRLKCEECALLVVDMQEKLLPAIHGAESVARNVLVLTQAFALFRRPLVFTEQYPQGLGHTVPELLRGAEQTSPTIVEKTRFNAAGAVAGFRSKNIVVCGVETHVCVRQTALELLAQGKVVTVVADATGSRREEHRRVALEELRARGAVIVSAESLLFDWLEDSRHPLFKSIARLIK
ncbi:MAG: isochorismatase family protein [Verrucomicrobiales bacterium]|jgi:nicotinamidase-related amidase|nr:isochorismatase family protein [Verrucomicrobiales bacterium]